MKCLLHQNKYRGKRRLFAIVFLVELVNTTVALDHAVAADVERMVFGVDFRAVHTIFGFHGAAGLDGRSIAHLNGELFVIWVNAWFHNGQKIVVVIARKDSGFSTINSSAESHWSELWL